MAPASWTWLVYLATHNNAAAAGEASVARMRAAQLGEGVRVLVQEATPDRTVRRMIGANPEQVADLGQIDSGDPATLLDFIRWGAQTAPAQRYALVLWSHGTGWEPKEMVQVAQTQPPPPVPVTTSELTQRGDDEDGRHVFFSTTMRSLLDKPTPAERAIAFDDGSGHSLDTIELGQVATEAAKILGQPIDLVGMNACRMSSIEVAYQLRNNARVYVASEEDMPVQSWPYDDILTRLAAQPDTDALALGKLIVERYCAYFRANPIQWGLGGLPRGATLAAVALDQTERLAEAAHTLAAALKADMDNQMPAVWAAHKATCAFKSSLYDLRSFCHALADQSAAAPAIAAAAHAVAVALDDQTLILAQDHTSPAYDGVGGVTTYLMPPTPGKTLSPYYAQTAYAHDTTWGDFLAAYQAAAQ